MARNRSSIASAINWLRRRLGTVLLNSSMRESERTIWVFIYHHLLSIYLYRYVYGLSRQVKTHQQKLRTKHLVAFFCLLPSFYCLGLRYLFPQSKVITRLSSFLISITLF